MKRLNTLVFILVLLLSSNLLSGEENIISVSAVPCGTVPLGSSSNLFGSSGNLVEIPGNLML